MNRPTPAPLRGGELATSTRREAPLLGGVGGGFMAPIHWAQLRTCEHSAAQGVVPALEKMVAAIRTRCSKARIIVRGDSGFGVEEIMVGCEGQLEVYHCLGIGKHSGLIDHLAPALAEARARHCLAGGASTRVFAEFEYQTKTSWSCQRRVIGKAEVMAGGDNPRFVVTNLPEEGFAEEQDRERFTPARLYEQLYGARGEMENVLKQQVLDLQGDRMSTLREGWLELVRVKVRTALAVNRSQIHISAGRN